MLIAYPSQEKTDFNDLLRDKGTDALKQELKALIPFDKWQKMVTKPNLSAEQLKKTIATMKSESMKLPDAEHPVKSMAKQIKHGNIKAFDHLKQGQVKSLQKQQNQISQAALQKLQNIEKEI